MNPNELRSAAEAYCNERSLTLGNSVGSGAFKATFEATTATGTSLALKVFHQGSSSERTAREIEAMRRCDHENIGKLVSLDSVDVAGATYLVLLEEFLSGGTLANQISVSPMPFLRVKSLGVDLINAVAHIASHDLVHRDLKPENIMFRSDCVSPVVIDFGLVRNLADTSLTRTWVAMGPGTPYYASPEQLANRKHLIDWRTDQFALGVILTECAFGYHPYADPGDSVSDIVEKVANRESVSEHFRREATERGLPVLLTMIAPFPVQRYHSPRKLLDDWSDQRELGA